MPPSVDLDTCWTRILERLRERIPPASYSTWYARIRPRALTATSFELGVPSRFFKTQLAILGGVALLAEVAAEVLDGAAPAIELHVDGELLRRLHEDADAVLADIPTAPSPDHPTALAAPLASATPAPQTHPAYRFETFVAGRATRFPLAAAREAVTHPGACAALVLCGGTGTGKTHLLHAIAAETHRRHPARRVLRTDARAFLAEYTQAHFNHELDRFRARYAEADTLAMDDFHVLAEGNKAGTVAEFVALFDRMTHAAGGKQLVLATSVEPSALTSLPEGLRNRLSAALAIRLAFPDDGDDGVDAAIRLIRAKAQIQGASVPRDVARVLAEASPRNARALEGAVGRLCALARLEGLGLTPAVARLAARELTGSLHPSERVLTVDDVVRAVSDAARVAVGDMRSRSRLRTVCRARLLAMTLARRLTGASLAEIAAYLGGRNHSTVSTSIKRFTTPGWTEEPSLRRMAETALAALGRTESLAGLFPMQGRLFEDDPFDADA